MAFGIKREELQAWKSAVAQGEIAFLTHYWLDERFPEMKTVTKVGCSNLDKLAAWCRDHGLEPRYIHRRGEYPHFDLFGPRQAAILKKAGQQGIIQRFGIKETVR
ncbi:hypothetical protein A7K91_23870 [Paenibacillus oryzae]|uniref:YneQ n=1 Tax=Paenibacillus oryzae TaxID=1844972 RepID=A0A1A5YCM1_9BACL|nr:hypothetical protein [Paenibacillus oryzae]OBR63140.1 hypothetical protein A7K91_23870 [Paenibacillus oryzae]